MLKIRTNHRTYRSCNILCPLSLTHLCSASHKKDTGKHNRPKSDYALSYQGLACLLNRYSKFCKMIKNKCRHLMSLQIQLTLVISNPLISNNRLSQVKILSLPKHKNRTTSKHENRTTSKTYCEKEEKLLLRSNFSSFPQCFRYSSIQESNYI